MADNLEEIYIKPVAHRDNKRTLSATESVYHHSALLNPPQSFAIFVVILESSNPIPPDMVRKSLNEESKKHMLLRSRIRTNTDGYDEFQEIEDLDMETGHWIDLECQTNDNIQDWNVALRDNIKNKPFDFAEGPVWRALWIESNLTENTDDVDGTYSYTLVFISSHAILDGLSISDFAFAQFLPTLNNLLNGDELSIKSIDQSDSIQLTKSTTEIYSNLKAPQESYQQYPVPFLKEKALGVGISLISMLNLKPKPPPMRVFENKNNNGCTEFHQFEIDEETAFNFRRVCKENSLSFQAMLMLLIGNAMKECENHFPHFKANIHEIRYPVDVRRFNKALSTSPLPVAVHVQSVAQKIRPQPTENVAEFLKYAHEVSESVRSFKGPAPASDLIDSVVILQRNNFFQKGIQYAPQGILFSNIGNCDGFQKLQSTDIVKAKQCYATSLTHNTIFASAAALNKKMFCVLSYNSEWLNADFAKVVEKNMRSSMKTLVKGLSVMATKGRGILKVFDF
ncbi:uncharacterized protein [Clytia hemisphaerica]|uniref:Alcohol acetyltransferase n=1 Tax=Clytia hemisphaerica TaxID=252671 RepID=A0A7M5X3R1_9CNID|eukprot:TCONS_00071737-protein